MVAANAPQEPNDRQEAEVNEPLELDKYMYCGAWQYTLHDPVTHRTVRVDPRRSSTWRSGDD